MTISQLLLRTTLYQSNYFLWFLRAINCTASCYESICDCFEPRTRLAYSIGNWDCTPSNLWQASHRCRLFHHEAGLSSMMDINQPFHPTIFGRLRETPPMRFSQSSMTGGMMGWESLLRNPILPFRLARPMAEEPAYSQENTHRSPNGTPTQSLKENRSIPSLPRRPVCQLLR